MELTGLAAYAADTIEIDGVPNEIKILPLGTVQSQKGTFQVDDESFEKILKQYTDRKLDIVIDYEHQTLENVQAPAGGWVKGLYKGTDAIIAKVEWTKKAAEYLKNKEYRYLSPVVLTRKSDQKAIGLHSIALTNTPAIDGMFAIVNSLNIEDLQKNNGGHEMELEKLIKLLGLEDTADEEEISKAIAKAVKAQEPGNGDGVEVVANSTILTLLELDEAAKTEDVTASIMALKAGSNGDMAEIRALKQRLEEKEADDQVMQALKSGKISAAQKEWAKSYALKDPKGFQSFVEKAPAVVPVGKIAPKEQTAQAVEVDVKVMKNLGISKEDIEKYGTKEDDEL